MASSNLISDGNTKVVINNEISVKIPKGMIYSTESKIINPNANGVSRALVCIKEGEGGSLGSPYVALRCFVVMEPNTSLVQLDSGADLRRDDVEGVIQRYITMLLAIFGGEVVLHKQTADLLVYYKKNEEHRYQFAAVTAKNVYTGQIWVNDSDDTFNITKQWLSGIEKYAPAAGANHSAVRSAGLAEQIVAWFQEENTLVPLADIQAHFSSYNKQEVKRVLDMLRREDILYGGENIIGNMYGLVSDEAADVFLAGVVFDIPAEKPVKQDNQKHSRYQAAVEKYLQGDTSTQIRVAKANFVALKGYLDAESYIKKCDEKISELIAKEEKGAKACAALEVKRKEEEARALKAAAYEKKYAAWVAEKEAIESRREQEIRTAVNAYYSNVSVDVQKWHQEEQQRLTELATLNRKKIADAEAKRASLGFFQFMEKSACRQTILQAEQFLVGLSAEASRLNVAYEKKQRELKKMLRNKETEIAAEIERQYPIPAEPEKPDGHRQVSTSAAKNTKKASQSPDQMFAGCTFVVADMPSRSEDARIRREIKLHGGTPVTSVTQKLDYLVCTRVARGITTRIDAALDNQAKGFPVKIITVREFDNMISNL